MDKKEHLIDVQPIRSTEQIEDMKWVLKRHLSERDYMLFLIGINTDLRVSDLLHLETEHLLKLKKKKWKGFRCINYTAYRQVIESIVLKSNPVLTHRRNIGLHIYPAAD